jgi:RNase adaptor protein for sRNA GlmZ degradation
MKAATTLSKGFYMSESGELYVVFGNTAEFMVTLRSENKPLWITCETRSIESRVVLRKLFDLEASADSAADILCERIMSHKNVLERMVRSSRRKQSVKSKHVTLELIEREKQMIHDLQKDFAALISHV